MPRPISAGVDLENEPSVLTNNSSYNTDNANDFSKDSFTQLSTPPAGDQAQSFSPKSNISTNTNNTNNNSTRRRNVSSKKAKPSAKMISKVDTPTGIATVMSKEGLQLLGGLIKKIGGNTEDLILNRANVSSYVDGDTNADYSPLRAKPSSESTNINSGSPAGPIGPTRLQLISMAADALSGETSRRPLFSRPPRPSPSPAPQGEVQNASAAASALPADDGPAEPAVAPVQSSFVSVVPGTKLVKGAVLCGKNKSEIQYIGKGFTMPPRESPGPIYQPLSTLDTTHGVSFARAGRDVGLGDAAPHLTGTRRAHSTPNISKSGTGSKGNITTATTVASSSAGTGTGLIALPSTLGKQVLSRWNNPANTVFLKGPRFDPTSAAARDHADFPGPGAYAEATTCSTNDGKACPFGGGRAPLGRVDNTPGPGSYDIEQGVIEKHRELGQPAPVFIAHNHNYSGAPAFSFGPRNLRYETLKELRGGAAARQVKSTDESSSAGTEGGGVRVRRPKAMDTFPGPGAYNISTSLTERTAPMISFTKDKGRSKRAGSAVPLRHMQTALTPSAASANTSVVDGEDKDKETFRAGFYDIQRGYKLIDRHTPAVAFTGPGTTVFDNDGFGTEIASAAAATGHLNPIQQQQVSNNTGNKKLTKRFNDRMYLGAGIDTTLGVASPGPIYSLPPTPAGPSVTMAFKERYRSNKLTDPGAPVGRVRFLGNALSDTFGGASPGPKYNIREAGSHALGKGGALLDNAPGWPAPAAYSFGVSDRYFNSNDFDPAYKARFGTADKPYTSPGEARFISRQHSKAMRGKASPGPGAPPNIDVLSQWQRAPAVSFGPPPRQASSGVHVDEDGYVINGDANANGAPGAGGAGGDGGRVVSPYPAPGSYDPVYTAIDPEPRAHKFTRAERLAAAPLATEGSEKMPVGAGGAKGIKQASIAPSTPGPGHYCPRYLLVESQPPEISIGIL